MILQLIDDNDIRREFDSDVLHQLEAEKAALGQAPAALRGVFTSLYLAATPNWTPSQRKRFQHTFERHLGLFSGEPERLSSHEVEQFGRGIATLRGKFIEYREADTRAYRNHKTNHEASCRTLESLFHKDPQRRKGLVDFIKVLPISSVEKAFVHRNCMAELAAFGKWLARPDMSQPTS
jgi:hypothetical protein